MLDFEFNLVPEKFDDDGFESKKTSGVSSSGHQDDQINTGLPQPQNPNDPLQISRRLTQSLKHRSSKKSSSILNNVDQDRN